MPQLLLAAVCLLAAADAEPATTELVLGKWKMVQYGDKPLPVGGPTLELDFQKNGEVIWLESKEKDGQVFSTKRTSKYSLDAGVMKITHSESFTETLKASLAGGKLVLQSTDGKQKLTFARPEE